MTDLIPLCDAAAHALRRLVPDRVARSDQALRSIELIAREIFARVPVYARDCATGALARASDAQLHLPGRELLVKSTDMESVVEALVAEYVGVAPCLRPAPVTGNPRRRSAR